MTPTVIAHRGASGYRPEHTLSAYRLAVALGADAIEPDLVPTADGVLVARHENEISETTDIAERREFASRRTTKVVDGQRLSGWFTEDLTLAELKSLRAVERLPRVRPASARYDGRHQVVTLDEILLMLAEESQRAGRQVGLVAEVKHSTYFAGLGLPIEETLVATLRDHGLDHRGSGVTIESFETTNLRRLRTMTDVPLVQLVDAVGSPADLVEQGDPVSYADLCTRHGLRGIAAYADGVSFAKDLVLRDGRVTPLVEDAHLQGLSVLVWTLRDENQFMSRCFRRGRDPYGPGDAFAEARAFFEAGVDGVFTDHPDTVVQARAEWSLARTA